MAIDLKIKADEAIEDQKEYWNLQQLNTLHQVYDAIKDDIWSFVELYKLIKDAGTDQKQAKRLLEIANNDLPRVEELYKNLCREVEKLTFEKLGAAETIQELNNEVMHLSVVFTDISDIIAYRHGLHFCREVNPNRNQNKV